jgi:hypothetical protein
MDLEAGLTFGIAPRFHCRTAWEERLRLNGGLVRRAGVLHPRDDWRTPTAAELRLLLGATSEAGQGGDAGSCALMNIPANLRQRWWDVAGRRADDPADATAYEAFVGEVLELLRFKGLPLPPRCASAAIVSRPDQPSTRLDAAETRLAGFGFGSLAGSSREPLAMINLGDEASRIVLLTRDVAGDHLAALAASEPDYPLVSITLDPGEGLWLPAPAPAFDGWTIGKHDVDVVLTIDHIPP